MNITAEKYDDQVSRDLWADELENNTSRYYESLWDHIADELGANPIRRDLFIEALMRGNRMEAGRIADRALEASKAEWITNAVQNGERP